MSQPTPPRNEKAKNRAARLRLRLDQLAAQVTEILASRIDQLAKGEQAETKQLLELIKGLTEIATASGWNSKLARAIANNPSVGQHQPGNGMSKRLMSYAARTKKASQGDGREGAEKQRRQQAQPPQQYPSWDELKAGLIARGELPRQPAPMLLPSDDDEPVSKPPASQESQQDRGQDPAESSGQ